MTIEPRQPLGSVRLEPPHIGRMKEGRRAMPRTRRSSFPRTTRRGLVAFVITIFAVLAVPFVSGAEDAPLLPPPLVASPEQAVMPSQPSGAANLPPEAVQLPSLPLPAPAGPAQPVVPPAAPPALPEETTFVDVIHEDLSKSITATAIWLDSFFYDPRFAAEENTTRIVLREDAYDEKGSHLIFSTHVQVKLIFPWLKKRLHLILSGDPDEQTAAQGVLADTPGPRALEETTKARNSGGALGYFFKNDERRNISLRAGLRYRGGKIVFFMRPHYRVLYNIGTWNLRITQEFPYWSDTKWESLTAIDLERTLSSSYFFRSSLIGSWQEGFPGYSYSAVIALVKVINPVSALSYEWVNSFIQSKETSFAVVTIPFNTTPQIPSNFQYVLVETKYHNVLTQVALDVRYRRQLWRPWIYFEIAPGVRFPRDHHFKTIPNILFRLEMTFGGK